MGKDITDKIVEDLIGGLPKVGSDVIYIFGGDDKIRNEVICKIASKVRSIVTDNPSVKSEYPIDLEYFIKMYNDC